MFVITDANKYSFQTQRLIRATDPRPRDNANWPQLTFDKADKETQKNSRTSIRMANFVKGIHPSSNIVSVYSDHIQCPYD